MASDPKDPTTTDDENQPVGVDRVMMPSIRVDGTPDQTPGFEIVDPDEDEDEAPAPKRRGRKADPETTAER